MHQVQITLYEETVKIKFYKHKTRDIKSGSKKLIK